MTTQPGGDLQVADLHRDEIPEAIAVLPRAMRANPVHIAAWGPDPERHRTTIERLFSGLVRVMSAQTPITDKVENVPFYAARGFETVGEEDVLGVPNWFMRRSPRRVATHSGAPAGHEES